MERHMGVVQLTPELLGQLLNLPDRARVTGARFDPFLRVIEVLVEDPTLPAVCDGDMPQVITLETVFRL